RAQVARDLAHDPGAQVAPDDIAAERERETGLLEPPCAEVLPELEALLGVGQLALVNQEPDLGFAREDGGADPIERDHQRLHFGLEKPEGEVGRGPEPGYGDPLSPERGARIGGPRAGGDEAGA